MKKIFSLGLLGISLISYSQISIAGKVNLLFPTSEAKWSNFTDTVTETYKEKGKNNVGYNFGLSVKVGLPGSFFLMPELYYTSFKNEFKDPLTNVTLKSKNNRVDLPVLVGVDILKENFGVFVGPVASYNLSTENQYDDFRENAKNNFTVGYQLGAHVMLGKLILNARYEGAVGKDEREFIDNNINYTVRYDNRPSLFILGLGYKF